jgi:O-antigen ligase
MKSGGPTRIFAGMPRPLLLLPVSALLAVVPFGHVQGLRGLLCVAVGIAAVAIDNPSLRPVRSVLVSWVAWMAFGVLSAAWSVNPALTLRSAFYELVLPLIAFCGAAKLTDSESSLRTACIGLGVGLAGLALLSLFAHLAGKPQAMMGPEMRSAGVLRYHPGVGVASTFAALAFALWLMLLQAGRAWRVTAASLILCTVVIGAAAPNRMFWITLLGTVILFAMVKKRRFTLPTILRLSSVMVLTALLTVVLFAASLQQRSADGALTPQRIAQSFADDPRIIGWQTWGALVLQRPLVGVGFGKALPRATYESALPPEVLKKDPSLVGHAHNLLLNTMLQVGAVGLMLYLILILVLVRFYAHALRDTRTALAGRAGIALVGAMLLKNTTDDFMVYAIVIEFWALAGMLAGFVARRQDTEPLGSKGGGG